MLALTAVALLLSASPSTPPMITLASPGFTTVKLEPQLGDFYADHFSQQLVLQGGLSVTTQSEIRALLGFERQKELLGCAEDSSSCIAELAGALGVEALITGNVGRVGSRFVLNIKIVASSDGRALSVQSGQVTTEDALLDFLNAAAKRAAAEVKRALRSQQSGGAVHAEAPSADVEATSALTRSGGVSGLTLGTGIAGGALLIAGGVSLGLAASAHRRLESGTEVIADLDGHIQNGERLRTLGIVGLGLGAATVGLAAVLALTGSDSAPTSAAVVPVEGGAVAVVQGALSW